MDTQPKWILMTLNITLIGWKKEILVKLIILILCSFQAIALWRKVHSSTSFYFLHLKGKFNTMTFSYHNKILMVSVSCNGQNKAFPPKIEKIKICPNVSTFLSVTKFFCKYAKVLLENKELINKYLIVDLAIMKSFKEGK